MQTAYGQNLSLREAGFRIQEAQALQAFAVGNLLPQQQTLAGAYSRQMLSLGTGVQAGGGAGFPGIKRYFSVWNAGTQFAWELDFWGQYRRAIESADEGSLQNVAEELVENGDADAWTAGQLLQHIADRPAWLLLETSQYATRAWA